MNTPILFIVFNRPKTTQIVFEAIRKIKPRKMFIAADGPRSGNMSDSTLCESVRKISLDIDWPCEVKTLFRQSNLGCKMAVSSAIDWFFENVEEGIILEDDCLPDQTFFSFCEAMLEKYRNHTEVMHINGTNSQFGEKFGSYSYYFSHCPQVWGWATWKRAWVTYDITMKDLPNFIFSKKAYGLFKNKKVANFWNSLFTYMQEKKVDTWDTQWTFAIMNASGLAVTPNTNLVQNIGFENGATHTHTSHAKLQQKSGRLEKITHPPTINPDIHADIKLFKKIYYRNIFDIIKSLFNKMI